MVRSGLLWAVLASMIGLAVAPWLRWEADVSGWALLSGHNPSLRSGGLGLAVECVPPTVLLGLLTVVRRSKILAGWTAILALLGSAGALVAAARLSGDEWPGCGLSLAVVGYPVAFVVLFGLWLLFDRVPKDAVTIHAVRLRIAVASSALVVVGAGLACGTYWYSIGRVVDRSTAAPAPAHHPSGRPGRAMWTASSVAPRYAFGIAPDPAVEPLADGLFATIENGARGEITVRDAVTGAERWHYRRFGAQLGDLGAEGVAASADGRTLVALFHVRERWLAVGLDAETGSTRWERAVPGYLFFQLPTSLVGMGAGPVSAYAPGTGRRMWSTTSIDAVCDRRGSLMGGAGLTVLLAPCHYTQRRGLVRTAARAIDATGRERWVAQPPTGRNAFDGELYAVTEDAVVVRLWFEHGGDQVAVLNPATGRTRWTYNPSESTFLAVGDHVVLTCECTDGSRALTLRDAVSGRLTVGQPATGVVPPHWQVFEATIHNGRAYLLLKSGTQARLAVLDLGSSRLLGSYPLPALAPAKDDPTGGIDANDALQPFDGLVLVSRQRGGQVITQAIRVPDG
jgi:hypothetical protein